MGGRKDVGAGKTEEDMIEGLERGTDQFWRSVMVVFGGAVG